jgi:hypothetical protein
MRSDEVREGANEDMGRELILQAQLKADEATRAVSEWYEDDPALRNLVLAIPWIGAVIDNTLSTPGRRARRERLISFLTEVKETLDQLDGDKIDRAFVESPEFEGVVQDVLLKASNTSREEKLRMLRDALVGAATGGSGAKALMDTIWALIMELSPEHVAVLQYVDRKSRTVFSSGGDVILSTDGPPKPVVLDRAFEDLSSNVLNEIVTDLVGRGLLVTVDPDDERLPRQVKAYETNALSQLLLRFLRRDG